MPLGRGREWSSRVWLGVFKLELTLSVWRGPAARVGVCGGRPCGSAVFPVLWAPVALGFSPFRVAVRVPGGCNGVSAGTARVSGAFRPSA